MHSMRYLTSLFVIVTFLCTSLAKAQDEPDTVEIKSDSAVITFSLNGAYPIAWDIIDPEFVDPGESVPLIYKDGGPDFPYPFRLILDGPDGELTKFANSARYTYEESEITGWSSEHVVTGLLSERVVSGGAFSDTIHVFTSPVHSSGLQITKMFQSDVRFHTSFHVVFSNVSSESTIDLSDIGLTFGAGLGEIPNEIGGLGDSMYSYVEAVGYTDRDLTRFEPSEIPSEFVFVDNELNVDWIGIHNRYYLMALVPSNFPDMSGEASYPNELLDQLNINSDILNFFPEILLYRNLGKLGQGEEIVSGFTIYAGPKDPASLRRSGYNLNTVMYASLPNWMRWLTFKLGALLNAINSVVNVWWITLLILVVIVRILLFPLAQKGITMNAQMMADQAKLKPLIDAIKEKHKDPTLQYQKTMELYKEHGINPMAPMLGCLPVLFQLPILIAIFNLLGQEVKMQGATFLWVKDLSIPDQLFELPFVLPYFGGYFNLLPVLMSVTMVLTTNMGTPAEGDQKKSQMRSMTILAFIFFALFYSFPAGLVFYWMMSNIGQFIQQEIMTRRVNKAS